MIEKYKKSLIKAVNRGYLIGAFLTALAVIVALTFYSYNSYKSKKEILKNDYLALQRNTIKKEVNSLIELIKFKVSTSEKVLKDEIKSQVEQAVNIATSIYQKYSPKLGENKAKNIVKDALRQIRFNDGRGYLFAINIDGTEELFADKPELEGKKLTGTRDLEGRYVVLDMIKIAQEKGEGFYRYLWSKPVSEGLNHEKLSFIKYIPELKWIIGAGEYVEDVQNRIKKEILEKASTVRFGKSGYVFIFDFNGTYLVHIKKEFIGTSRFWYVDKNGVKVGETLLKESLKPEGGYVEFYWPKGPGDEYVNKISYSKSYNPWQWVICTGFYTDDVEEVLKNDWNELLKDLKTEIVFICIFTFLLSGLLHLIGKYYTGKINMDKNSLLNLLRDINNSETGNFKFSEFQIISDEIINYRKLAEKFKNEIIEKNQSYKNILNFLPIPVFLSDEQNMYFMNFAAYDFLKIQKHNDIKDIRLNNFIVEDFMCCKALKDIDNKEIKQQKFSMVDIEQNRYDVLLSAKKVTFEESEIFLCLVEDITHINMVHLNILKEKEFLNAVLENIKEMIFVLDNEGKILITSKQTKTFVGCENDFTFGDCFTVFDEDGEEVSCHIKKVLENNVISYFKNKTFQLKIKGQNPISISISASKIMLSDEVIGWIIVFRDITHILQMERNMNNIARLNSVGELAGGIAHNFNNVLGVIMNCVQIIDFVEDKNIVTELVDDIKKTVINAKSITAQLITFAKGGQPLKRVFDINQLIKSTVKLSLSGSDIVAEQNFKQPEIMVFADEGQISQVLQNIVINAKHAMNDSGILTAGCGIEDVDEDFYIGGTLVKKGRYAVVKIKDTGCGIPESVSRRIFEPYFTTKKMGTGLGLATSFRIMEKHGGFIGFESGKDGTTFFIYLPAHEADSKENARDNLSDDLSGLNVIVMDDEEYIRKSLSLMLENLGCHAFQASKGEEALEIYEQYGKEVQIAVLDLIVPGGMGGKIVLKNSKF